MAVLPFSENTKKEMVGLLKEYVAEHGLDFAVAAVLINKKLELKKRFKYELNKNKVVGLTGRNDITRATEVSPVGKELLKSIGMQIQQPKPTPGLEPKIKSGGKHAGVVNRVKNARLKAANLEPRLTSEELSAVPEAAKGNPFGRNLSRSRHVLSAERRARGINDPDFALERSAAFDGIDPDIAKAFAPLYGK